MAQNSVRNTFKRVLFLAGTEVFTVSDIRHTFASLSLGNGASVQYVKEQMGHSSISMTVDVYGHRIPSGNRDAVNALDPIARQSATTKKRKPATS